MPDNESRRLITDYLDGKVSRAQLLKAAAAAGIASVALPGLASAQVSTGSGTMPRESFPFFPQIPSGRYTPETVDEIVSNILTWATFEVAVFSFLLTTPALATQLGLSSGLSRSFAEAFNVELQSHIDFWSSIAPKAQPKATTFTVDPALVPNSAAALAFFEAFGATRAAMMIAAVREFAELGQPTLAKYAAQTEGLYAEERAISRMFQAMGGNTAAVPPNNKAFETDLFLYTRDAVAVLYGLGLVNGKGVSVPYPGRTAALAASGATAAAVIQRAPNNATTSVAVTGLGSLTAERT